MEFQVGDLGADHASDHAAVGALLAGYISIVTDLVLNSLAISLLAHVAHSLGPGVADLLYQRGALLLRFRVVTSRESDHHLHPYLEAANRSCRSSLFLVSVMKTSYYYFEGCLVYTFIFIILLVTRNRCNSLIFFYSLQRTSDQRFKCRGGWQGCTQLLVLPDLNCAGDGHFLLRFLTFNFFPLASSKDLLHLVIYLHFYQTKILIIIHLFLMSKKSGKVSVLLIIQVTTNRNM